jgi:hypothetical protein
MIFKLLIRHYEGSQITCTYNVLEKLRFNRNRKKFIKVNLALPQFIINLKNIFSMIVKLLMENLNLTYYERRQITKMFFKKFIF